MAVGNWHKGRSGVVNMLLLDAASLVAIIVVVALGGYFLVGSSLRRSAALEEEKKTLTTQLERLTELANTLGQGEETLTMLESGMADIDQRLPATMDFAEFYRDLTNLAAEQYVLLSEMQPGEIQQEDTYVTMPINVTAHADFEDFHRFLFGLGDLTRLTKLDSLTIGRSSGEQGCDIDMTILIYAARNNAGEADSGP